MTLAAVEPRIVVIGNGTRGPFSFTDDGTAIRVDESADLRVVRYSSTTVSSGVTLTSGTDYTVSGLPSAPTVTLAASQAVLASTERLEIERRQLYDQDLDLENGGDFSAPAIEERLDRITQMIQEISVQAGRSLRLHVLDATALSIPDAVTRANKHLGFDGVGNLVALAPASGSFLVNTGWESILTDPPGDAFDDLRGVYVLTDIDALQAQSWDTDDAPDLVALKQNHFSDDGGGFFTLDSADTSTADDNALTIVTLSGRRYKRMFKGAVNVCWYGATGDGSTDDQPAIQAMLNSLSSGDSAYFPPGKVFKCGSKLTLDGGSGDDLRSVRFIGESSGGIFTGVNNPRIFLDSNSSDTTLWDLTQVNDIEWNSIVMMGPGNSVANSTIIKATDENADLDLKILECGLAEADCAIAAEGRGIRWHGGELFNANCGLDIDWPSTFTPGSNDNQTADVGARHYHVSGIRMHGTVSQGLVRNRGASAHKVQGILIENIYSDAAGILFRGHANRLVIDGVNMIHADSSTLSTIQIEDVNSQGATANKDILIANSVFAGMTDNGSGVTREQVVGMQFENCQGVRLRGVTIERVERNAISFVGTIANFDTDGLTLRDTCLDRINSATNGTLRHPINFGSATVTDARFNNVDIIDAGSTPAVAPIVETSSATVTDLFLGRFAYDTSNWNLTDRVDGNDWQTISASLADDAATSIDVDGDVARKRFEIQVGGSASYRYSAGVFREATSVAITGHGDADIEFTTGALAGTTGTDNKFTMSVHTDEKLYFENRLGSAQPVYLRLTE